MKKLNIKNSYTTYLSKSKSPVPYSLYNNMNQEFFKYITKKILEGHKVFLPMRMGSLQVIGKEQKYTIQEGKVKGLAPDWGATKKYREANPGSDKIIYHTNSHTDNVRYKIKWSKYNMVGKNKVLYSLRFIRSTKRLLSEYIKNKTFEYIVK